MKDKLSALLTELTPYPHAQTMSAFRGTPSPGAGTPMAARGSVGKPKLEKALGVGDAPFLARLLTLDFHPHEKQFLIPVGMYVVALGLALALVVKRQNARKMEVMRMEKQRNMGMQRIMTGLMRQLSDTQRQVKELSVEVKDLRSASAAANAENTVVPPPLPHVGAGAQGQISVSEEAEAAAQETTGGETQAPAAAPGWTGQHGESNDAAFDV
jgi:hypothetical protein